MIQTNKRNTGNHEVQTNPADDENHENQRFMNKLKTHSEIRKADQYKNVGNHKFMKQTNANNQNLNKKTLKFEHMQIRKAMKTKNVIKHATTMKTMKIAKHVAK